MPIDSQIPAQDAPRPEKDIAAILGRTPKAEGGPLPPSAGCLGSAQCFNWEGLDQEQGRSMGLAA